MSSEYATAEERSGMESHFPVVLISPGFHASQLPCTPRTGNASLTLVSLPVVDASLLRVVRDPDAGQPGTGQRKAETSEGRACGKEYGRAECNEACLLAPSLQRAHHRVVKHPQVSTRLFSYWRTGMKPGSCSRKVCAHRDLDTRLCQASRQRFGANLLLYLRLLSRHYSVSYNKGGD